MSLHHTVLNSEIYTWNYFQNDDVCRLCWSRDARKVITIKSSENGKSIKNLLAEKIEDCLNLDLRYEGAPKKVCSKCFNIIDTFYDFKLFCCEADRKLNEILINHELETSDSLPEHLLDVALDKSDNYSDMSSDNHSYKQTEDNLHGYLNLTLLKVAKQTIKRSDINCPNIKYHLSSTDLSNSNIEDSIQEYLELPLNGGRRKKQKIKKEVKKENDLFEEKYSSLKTSNCNVQDSFEQYLNLAPHRKDHLEKIRKQSKHNKCVSKSKYSNKKASDSNNGTPIFKDQSQKLRKYPNNSSTFCFICRTLFKTVDKLTEHNSDCHGIETNGEYKCFGCDKRFKNSKNRLGHEINFCKGLKDGYRCGVCERHLPKRRTYEMHMKAHRLNKPANLPGELFKCGKCYELFRTREDLIEHKKSHEIKKDFVCETCGRRFSRRDYLNKHMLTHQGLRQHACPHCEYKAVQKASLLVHLRKHTGERPFSCDLCPQRCVTSSNLRAHRRRHLGVKQFQCTICSKKFGYKQSLEEHIATTHERVVQSHTCPHCGAIYSRGRGLRRHVEAKHRKTKEKLPSMTDGTSGEELILTVNDKCEVIGSQEVVSKQQDNFVV